MRTGTPGFIGEKLREAREARGWTATALAHALNVTRSAVSHYENGDQTPRPEIMQKIEELLNVPAHFFRRIPNPKRTAAIFYRSMSATTKQARTAAEWRYVWLQEITQYLREFINFPKVDFPDFNLPEDPYRISFDLIEEIALKTRRYWNLGDGAISNVTWLLENKGAVISRYELEADTLDAFSEWNPIDNTPYIVLGSGKNVAARSRYDAAHELGHLVLHRRVSKTRINTPQDFNLIERQANRFAGAFLFPAPAFFKEVGNVNLDTFLALKSVWGLSIQMMIYRADDLELASPEHTKRLWANCARRGWRLKEPLDEQMPVEKPRMLRRAFEMLVNNDVQTIVNMLSALPYSPRDIEELAGLPEAFFTEKTDVISLKDFVAKRAESSKSTVVEENRTADVVEFRPSKERKLI